jgi:hypothetical protein
VNSPLDIAFRQSATVGLPIVRRIVSATSITVPAGATLGFGANYAGLVAVYAVDTGSGVVIGVSGVGPGKNLDDTTLESTTLLNTSSDAAFTIYTANAQANVAIRLLGYVLITGGAIAGDWSNAPSLLSAMPFKHGNFSEHAGSYIVSDTPGSSTYSCDASRSNSYNVTVFASATFTMNAPTFPIGGFSYIWFLNVGATAVTTITWPANFKWAGGVNPTAFSANTKNVISCVFDGTDYVCSAVLGAAV